MTPKPLSKPDIIRLAACHTCCASRGEPCTFARCDDPKLLRTVAKQSHLARIQLARKIVAENEKELHSTLDSLTLKM